MPQLRSIKSAKTKPSRSPLELNKKLMKVLVLPLRDTIFFPGVTNHLLVARPGSIKTVSEALKKNAPLLLLAQRDHSISQPAVEDMHEVGVSVEILHVQTLPDSSLRLNILCHQRARVSELKQSNGIFSGTAQFLEHDQSSNVEVEALARECLARFIKLSAVLPHIPSQVTATVGQVESPSELADLIAYHTPLPLASKQELMETVPVKERLKLLLSLLTKEDQVQSASDELAQKISDTLEESHREFYLREQMKVIQGELQKLDPRSSESEIFRLRLQDLGCPTEVEARIASEIDILDSLSSNPTEANQTRAYIETLLSIPWKPKISTGQVAPIRNLAEIKNSLQSSHFGQQSIKDRILEWVAVMKLNPETRAPILAFVGPPGVGKTSFAQAIATALDRPFARISLGGVKDEADIRGHRRTYVGAFPGKIVQALRSTGSDSPVILLDELDKVADGTRSDPAAALLEVLDREQNHSFLDHYLDIPIDLSGVTFIATANYLDDLPRALVDRLEVIECPAYTDREKAEIAFKHLIPRAVAGSGLTPSELKFSDAEIQDLIQDTTFEPGIRQLQRNIEAIARQVAVYKVQNETAPPLARLIAELPQSGRLFEVDKEQSEVGLTFGLMVSPIGGHVAPIEVQHIPGGSANQDLILTGGIGPTMKESAIAALSWARSNRLKDQALGQFHIHISEGALPKDGPSAGLPFVIGLVSAGSGIEVPAGWVSTGEITLLGQVSPVGGLREKLLAAHRSGFSHVILSKRNEAEALGLNKSLETNLQLHFVAHVTEALELLNLSLQAPSD